MAALAAVGRLDEAAEDLRRWERKLRAAQERLEQASSGMKWEGRGAEDFRGRVRTRTGELDAAADAVRRTHRLLEQAADEVRAQRRRVEAAEQTWALLVAQGVAPAPATPPPPGGDATWPAWLRTTTGRPA